MYDLFYQKQHVSYIIRLIERCDHTKNLFELFKTINPAPYSCHMKLLSQILIRNTNPRGQRIRGDCT